MHGSLEQFLEQVARPGSRVGGGSVAALRPALAAALLEKLIVRPQVARRLRRTRRECLRLVQRDAGAFTRVVRAVRRSDQSAFRGALRRATEVPWQVFEHAQAIQSTCRAARRSVKPRFQSDLRCAMALALASAESARTLIETNLAWLNDPRYSTQMRRRLQSASRKGR